MGFVPLQGLALMSISSFPVRSAFDLSSLGESLGLVGPPVLVQAFVALVSAFAVLFALIAVASNFANFATDPLALSDHPGV